METEILIFLFYIYSTLEQGSGLGPPLHKLGAGPGEGQGTQLAGQYAYGNSYTQQI